MAPLSTIQSTRYFGPLLVPIKSTPLVVAPLPSYRWVFPSTLLIFISGIVYTCPFPGPSHTEVFGNNQALHVLIPLFPPAQSPVLQLDWLPPGPSTCYPSSPQCQLRKLWYHWILCTAVPLLLGKPWSSHWRGVVDCSSMRIGLCWLYCAEDTTT